MGELRALRASVTPPRDVPNPPKHLSRSAKRWWRDVAGTYELDPHHLRLLQLACEAWDRAQQARKALDEAGSVTFTDRFGQPKARPEVAVERDSRIGFARLVRELDLEGEPAPDPRPPRRGA